MSQAEHYSQQPPPELPLDAIPLGKLGDKALSRLFPEVDFSMSPDLLPEEALIDCDTDAPISSGILTRIAAELPDVFSDPRVSAASAHFGIVGPQALTLQVPPLVSDEISDLPEA